MTSQWRQTACILVAVVFGGAAWIAAAPAGGGWAAAAGFGTFVLVVGGYLIATLLDRPAQLDDQDDHQDDHQVRTAEETDEQEPRLEPAAEPKPRGDVAVVFVHGFLSSGEAWTPFERLIRADADLAALDIVRFEYETGVVRTRPGRRIPDLDTVARRLGTRFGALERHYRAVVIVSHSMGGLVAQRFIARMLQNGQGSRLVRIKRVVMFGCPTAGSDFLRTLRTLVPFRHVQERALRTLNSEITQLQEIILSRVVHAKKVTGQTCPIPLRLYAGESDNVVLPPAALGVYPDDCTGVVKGDHTSIVRPTSPEDESYQVLKSDLETVLGDLGG